MNLAIASGKGGTGKTTVAASLTHVWPRPVIAVDLDVEEPNLHLFLNPEITTCTKATLPVPVADESKCTYCRKCAELCQFKAISVLGEVLLIFPEMCHGCGGCLAVCPEQALTLGQRELGEVIEGNAGRVEFLMGRLRVGEAMSPPLMRAVKSRLNEKLNKTTKDVIIDCPPGVSCPAVNAVMDSDAILLVTEPTPFGLYDLQLAYKAFASLGKPMAVVINRSGIGHREVEAFCRSVHLPIAAHIPYQDDIAQAYAHGQIIAAAVPLFYETFVGLANSAMKMVTESMEAAHA
jgi:MinD superfamily P-loop ATPase